MTHHQALGATDESMMDMDSEYPYWAMNLS